jgi:L-iditol 2-dehydrogenase
MLALRKVSTTAHELTLEEVRPPEPGPGQVRIAVSGAGICGTDQHILHGDYLSRPPVTLGHEVAGTVDAVGEAVDGAWLGARVAPETAFSTCGSCAWCRVGKPMLCAQRVSIGSGVDGGFASHIIVPARLLHRLPDWLDEHAAALMEPLACVCNAMLDPGAIDPGDRVVVSGAGPVGILAAQVARACGGQVTLLGTAGDEARLAVAASLGIDAWSLTDAARKAALDEEASARGIAVVVECAGVEAAVEAAIGWLRPGGRLIQVGLLAGVISVPFGQIVLRELTVRAGFGSSPRGWMRASTLVASRQVRLEPLVTDVLPLREWRTALSRFERRQGLKTVFDPRLA